MAFKYATGLRGNAGPVLREVVIDNSDDIQIGDAVKVYNAGNAEKATAARPIFGIVHQVVDKFGLGLAPEKVTKATQGSATINAAGDTVTVASDNETVDLIAAVCDVSQETIYSGAQDGTVGTTNSSDKVGASIDIIDESQLDESSAVRTGQAQMYGWGTDPNDTTRILCSILESELKAGGSYS